MATTLQTSTDKQDVLDCVNRFPETATLRQIADEIAMMAAIQQGLDDIEAGRTLTNEEVKRRSETWITR